MKTLHYSALMTLLVGFLIGSQALASAADQGPRELLVKVHDQIVEVLDNEKERLAEDPKYLEQKLRELVDPHVDFTAMSRLMLGGHWKKASEEQQASFIQEFRAMLARIYGKSISLYDGQALAFEPYEPGERKNLAVIRARVDSDEESVPIDFRLRHKDSDGWKIYDISVDSVSLVKNYKSSFRQDIQEAGMDGLLAKMAATGTGDNGEEGYGELAEAPDGEGADGD
ncbi:MAG: MlaC/ttg2D family ABC transporter substrate-binding protein [Pseudomonadota bacterium]